MRSDIVEKVIPQNSSIGKWSLETLEGSYESCNVMSMGLRD